MEVEVIAAAAATAIHDTLSLYFVVALAAVGVTEVAAGVVESCDWEHPFRRRW